MDSVGGGWHERFDFRRDRPNGLPQGALVRTFPGQRSKHSGQREESARTPTQRLSLVSIVFRQCTLDCEEICSS